MKKIAVLTQSRNDNFFLSRWINYYGNIFGEEHLYIFLDGEDQIPPDNIGKTNLTIRKKEQSLSRIKGDSKRINFLSNFSKKLFTEKKYDIVIGTDCDEFLVVDPKINKGLKAYLSELHIKNSVSALGIDIGHNTNIEGELDPKKSILEQRQFGVLSTRYTKPSVINKPVRWGSGFHRIKHKNFTIDNNLYLIHIGYCDLKLITEKLNINRVNSTWKNHIKRQAKTIDLATNLQAKEADKTFPLARKIQTYTRPIFAWNKPSMLMMKWLVKIPERFTKIFI